MQRSHKVMQRILYTLCMLTVFTQCVYAQEQKLTLIWSDEFDQEGLIDPDKWNYAEGFTREDQMQYYTRARRENVRVENGILVIEARKEEFKNRRYKAGSNDFKRRQEYAHYTSGRIDTRDKVAFQYGRFEVRAKLPKGKGTHSAIWMRSNTEKYGEIDIMEHIGRLPGKMHAINHFTDPNNEEELASGGKGNIIISEPFEEFHVYAIEWDEEQIKFFVDNIQYTAFNIDDAGKGLDNVFRQPGYFLLSFALGGRWAKKIDDSIFPQRYEIDYVRIYKLQGSQASIIVESDPGSGLTEERVEQLNESIMPRLTQAMLGATQTAVSSRIDNAFSQVPHSASYQINGLRLNSQSSLTTTLHSALQKLPSYIHTLTEGNIDWRQILANSSFALSLQDNASANDSTGAGGSRGLSLWGSGDYSRLSGKDNDLDWDGEVFSVQLGADKRIRDNLLLGGLVSWSDGDLDLDMTTKGSYQHQMTSLHPYLAWNSGDIQAWGSLGYGQGELEIELGRDKLTTDTRLLSLAGGVKGRLSHTLSLKSDISLARIDIDESDHSKQQNINSQRLRLLLAVNLSSCERCIAAIEAGLRYDGGAGDSGIGAVLDATAGYVMSTGLTLEGRLHTLIGRDDYTEWGLSGLISLTTAADGRGLAFSLSPSYGVGGSGTGALWYQNQGHQNQLGSQGFGSTRGDYQARLNARLSYGLFAPVGLLLPYSEITTGTSNRYRLGVQWQGNERFDVTLYGERHDNGVRAEQAILLEGWLQF